MQYRTAEKIGYFKEATFEQISINRIGAICIVFIYTCSAHDVHQRLYEIYGALSQSSLKINMGNTSPMILLRFNNLVHQIYSGS